METISILWRFEDLACDWSENNEHSRHILSVHGFRSLTVKERGIFMLYLLYLPTEIVFEALNKSYEFYENYENCEKS